MPPRFAESWDLLLSDPIAESIGDPPNPSCPPQSAPELLEENRHSSQGRLDNCLMATPASEPTAFAHSNAQQHSTPAVLRCLEELRRQLDLLRRSSSLSENEFDTPRLALLNRNLEILADAVATTTTTSGDPGLLTRTLSSGETELSYRCWEPCCSGGRRFSNRSNLVRHQRERSGEKAKLRCRFCNARFSRSYVRKAHEERRNCWQSLGNQ